MGEYDETQLVMLSALQHLLFCPRQCALIHIEQQWIENRFTAEGRIMHERVHSDASESRGEVKISFSLPLRSLSLGLIGKADVVEFHVTEEDQTTLLDETLASVHKKGSAGYWVPFPVEYKRGKPKSDNSDKVQLCAQAICLEEMCGIEVPKGALFYGKRKRRQEVEFDRALRKETYDSAQRLHQLLEVGKTPPPVYEKKCDTCSFIDVCMPKAVSGKKSQVERYYSRVLDL